MIIPISELEPQTLDALIEHFVLREGTDYGPTEYTLAQKVSHVRARLESGEAVLVWSELHESINIVARDELGAQGQ